MKCKRRSRNNKSKKPWMPRGSVLIPACKAIKNPKAYDRKREKRLSNMEQE